MTTLTHTQKWDRITKISLAAFVLGLAGMIALDLLDVASVLQLLFMLAAIVGLIMSFIAGPKTLGGLKTGIIGLITGAVFWIAGTAMINNVGHDTILGVEFLHFSSPLWIIGWPLQAYGMIILIVGGVMAMVTYLRRVLKAVEGNKANVSG